MSISELFRENTWCDLKANSLTTNNIVADSVFKIGTSGSGVFALNSNQTYTSFPAQLVDKVIFFNSETALYSTVLTVPSGDAFVQYFLSLLKLTSLPLGFYFDLTLKIEKNVGGNANSSVRLFMPDVNYYNNHANGVDSHVDNLQYFTNSQMDVTQVVRFSYQQNQTAGYPTWFVY
jgi:hypothetical protein